VFHLAKVLETYGIANSIFCITSDNASNNGTMVAEIKKLIDFDSENCLLGCMPQVIKLASMPFLNWYLKELLLEPTM
jgi:hypothetical protein